MMGMTGMVAAASHFIPWYWQSRHTQEQAEASRIEVMEARAEVLLERERTAKSGFISWYWQARAAHAQAEASRIQDMEARAAAMLERERVAARRAEERSDGLLVTMTGLVVAAVKYLSW